MSILIKDMEIPDNCTRCDYIGLNVAVGCPVMRGTNGRAVDCPLISVPDHGRLIDADEFYADINESVFLTDGFKELFNLWFDEQQTIIPADKGCEA